MLHTDGRGKDGFTVYAGGSEQPASEETLSSGGHYFTMDGKAVFETATAVVPQSIETLLTRNEVKVNDLRYMLPHQPSIGILKTIAQKIGLPFEKVKTNMDKYANTSGGTIPIVLDETLKSDPPAKGDHLLFAAVGAGWTWGTALYKW